MPAMIDSTTYGGSAAAKAILRDNTPTIEKTREMRKLESENGGNDIRLILIDAVLATDVDRNAADRLGLLPTTFSKWVHALGLRRQLRAIRAEQRLRRN